MIRLKQAVIVEGKYDRIKLAGILDATIIETGGFRIFKDPEKRLLIRTLAEKNGIIVLTDSDVAGFKIRSFIKSIAPNGKVIQAYIPPLPGKEKRKAVPSKEGFLGVEGTPDAILLAALQKAGVFFEYESAPSQHITKTDLYLDGLSGGKNSGLRRKMLMEYLQLPAYLSANALLDILNTLFSYEEYQNLLNTVFSSYKQANTKN